MFQGWLRVDWAWRPVCEDESKCVCESMAKSMAPKKTPYTLLVLPFGETPYLSVKLRRLNRGKKSK